MALGTRGWDAGFDVSVGTWLQIPTPRRRRVAATANMTSMARRVAHARFSYIGNALTENRHGLVVEAEVGSATGTIEREAAITMVVRHSPGSRRITLGADKAYDVHEFVDDLRDLNVTPHIAQNTTNRTSAIDARTTHHPGYAISQQKRKRTEEPFGWGKTIGGLARPMLRGVARIRFKFILTMAAYDLIRLPKLLGASA